MTHDQSLKKVEQIDMVVTEGEQHKLFESQHPYFQVEDNDR